MSGEAGSLFSNDAFYQAFCNQDLDAMDRLWARQRRVACIHPGWPPLTTRDDVMESWRAIFVNPGAPRVSCRNAEAFVAGQQGFVTCYEVFGKTLLAATNIFVLDAGIWKMVHHHAGPCSPPATGFAEEAEPPAIQ